jgi:hypothetical protein
MYGWARVPCGILPHCHPKRNFEFFEHLYQAMKIVSLAKIANPKTKTKNGSIRLRASPTPTEPSIWRYKINYNN